MKRTDSNKKSSSTPVEPLIISRAQRATAAEIARQQARAAWRQRAIRLVINAVVAAVALRVATIAVQPCIAALRSQRHIHGLRAQLHQEAARHQHLNAQIAYLKSPQGIEEEARKLGWTKAGEIALQIVTPEPKGSAKPSSPAPAVDKSLPVRISGSERVRLYLTKLFDHRK
jgi:cell division protein FtsB